MNPLSCVLRAVPGNRVLPWFLVFCLILALSPATTAQWINSTPAEYKAGVHCYASNGGCLFAGYGVALASSYDNGLSWSPAMAGLENTIVYSLATLGTNVFAGTFGRGVFFSNNNGGSWNQCNAGLTNPMVSCLFGFGTNLFAGSGPVSGLFFSSDYANSWNPAIDGLMSANIYAFAKNGTNVFVGTDGGVYVTTNNGTNWTSANNGLTRQNVRALAVIGSNLFAGVQYGGVYLSTDNGAIWNEASNGLSNNDVLCLAVGGRNLFAGTNGGGVYVSIDNGASWTAVNDGWTNPKVAALIVSGTNLVAGTETGMWWRALSQMVSVPERANSNPQHYWLDQNYPNPFNPSTTISYELPQAAQVNLSVHDVLGREVATLVNEKKTAGYHAATFDASRLSSGVYVYTLRAGNFVSVKKMLLVR